MGAEIYTARASPARLLQQKTIRSRREETERAAGRCAAAAPISGQTPAVCFPREHTVRIAGPTLLTALKTTHQIDFFCCLCSSWCLLSHFLEDVLAADVMNNRSSLARKLLNPPNQFCKCVSPHLFVSRDLLFKSFNVCLRNGCLLFCFVLFCLVNKDAMESVW